MKESAKSKRLWKLYRITEEEQKQIEEYQRKTEPYNLLMGQHLGTDHCHRLGLCRGRIDFRLNRALGIIESFAKENAANVLRALACYLDSPPAVTVLGKRFGLIGQAKLGKRKMIYGSENGPVIHKKKRRRKK